MSTSTTKAACLTLDVESDFATDHFRALAHIPQLADWSQRSGVPLTAFVEGRVLREYPEALAAFPLGTEFQLHCDDHRCIPDTANALQNGIASFERVFSRRPQGYRAANFRMTAELLTQLKAEGFAWDASYLQGPGSYRSGALGHPYRLPEGIWEIPVGQFPRLNRAAVMSRVSGVSLRSVQMATMGAAWPDCLVFVLHLVDLFPVWRSLVKATWRRRIGHCWNYRLGLRDPYHRFLATVQFLRGLGYSFFTCSDLLKRFRMGATCPP